MPARDVHPNTTPVIKLDADSFIARLEREIVARQAAERMAEKKSEELQDINHELELVLSGSVKILTDVLAMVRPEVFQKAAKVQRWARHIVPVLEVYRPWELDLAAMLCPLGVISLPDEIATKYALNQKLTKEEQTLVDESPGAAYQLLHNIPRMESVARAIYYSRKGYDGSGFPNDKIKGEDIPRTARILRILIDLADLATGEKRTRRDAFKRMAQHKQLYDLDIMKVVYAQLVEREPDNVAGSKGLVLTPGLLRPGDILNSDIVDRAGRLLLAAGAELTDVSIHRLHVLDVKGEIASEVNVMRANGANQAAKLSQVQPA